MGPQAVYFSILRDPVSLFISLWDYYELPKHMSKHRLTLEKFAMSSNKPEDIIWSNLNFHDMSLYDFGHPDTQNNNKTAIDLKIQEIDSTFDLIMIVAVSYTHLTLPTIYSV